MEFFTFTPVSGSNDGYITVNVSINSSSASRQGHIFVRNADSSIVRTITINQSGTIPPHPPVPYNKLMYTTVDDVVVTIKNTTGWTNADGEAVTIVSNTYINGQGWIEFSDDIVNIPDNAFWLNLSDDGRLNNLKTFIMPECIESIGINAFCANSGLTSINIPDTVQSIGEAAFLNTAITSIHIPYGITRIEDNTFASCDDLPEIILPDTVTYLGEFAFSHTPITSFIIPDMVTYIPYGLFYDCMALEEVSIPEGMTAIGPQSFYGCEALTGITIPESVNEIEQAAFAASGLVSITIPDGVTYIPLQGFCNCTSLTSIDMGNSIVDIRDRAFEMCGRLSSITLPSTVRNIYTYAFKDCTRLSEINAYSVRAPYLVSGQYVFYNVSPTGTLHYPQGSDYSTWIAALPAGWTAIADL